MSRREIDRSPSEAPSADRAQGRLRSWLWHPSRSCREAARSGLATYSRDVDGSREVGEAVHRCMRSLGARAVAFATGLDATADLAGLVDAPGDLADDARHRVLVLDRGFMRLQEDWGSGGARTCLWGMCPVLEDRAALAVLRDGDVEAFNRAVDYYVSAWYAGQGG